MTLYADLEHVLAVFDRDGGDRWLDVARRRTDRGAARQAAELLRAGARDQAERVLVHALPKPAGPADGSGLERWRPVLLPDYSGVLQPGGTTLL